MTSFGERLKTRVPDWPRFLARARDDRRNIAYDLLPLLDLKGREAVARALRRLKPHTRPFAIWRIEPVNGLPREAPTDHADEHVEGHPELDADFPPGGAT